MTQPEDDAARLARELAEATCGKAPYCPMINPSRAETARYRCWKDDFDGTVEYFTPIIRAHLAERDARERMVREAAERAADRVWRYFGHDIAGRAIADDLRAALSVKSDERTEETNG